MKTYVVIMKTYVVIIKTSAEIIQKYHCLNVLANAIEIFSCWEFCRTPINILPIFNSNVG
jgi:hypothetical protein